MNYDLQYPQMNHGQRLEVFKNELVDMFYAHYDQPMTAGEILRVLGAHGQVPYSYDTERNIFRCVRTVGERPVSLAFTKNGVASL
jgi:hypothetical protein